MAQKPMLRGEVGARVRVIRACGQRAAAAAFGGDERQDRETAPWRSVAKALVPAGRFGRSGRTDTKPAGYWSGAS